MVWNAEEIPFLREVYKPGSGTAEVDICFVHGLNPWSKANHAYETWTHDNGKFWPSDFLPEDIPEARIFVYGYNSNVAKEVSEARIKDHANVLLDRLQRKRKVRRQHGTTPIIFIGHSLGGLVIKQALLNARDDETYEPIRKCTYGLVFFGTPHRGGNNAAFGQLAAKVAKFVSGDRADNDLLECLRTNSLFTRDAAERFSHQLLNYRVISFFETIPMKLGIKGVADIVVESESAVLNLPGSRERREALNADHSSMCKIGTKGDMYEGVMGKLRDMVDDALDEFEGKQGAAGQTFLSPMSPARGRSTSPAFSTHIRTPSRHSPAVTEDVPRSIASPPAPPKPLALPPASTIARALWAYSGPDSNDLPLKEGDMITDIQKIDPEWWQGTNPRGQTGIFPRTYVEELFRGEAPSEYNPWERPAAPAHSISVPTPKQEEPVLARASHSESDLVEQPMQIVHSALCDHCKQQIKGIRHKCETCLDWDYCSGCVIRADILHNPEHHFRAIYDLTEDVTSLPTVASPVPEVRTTVDDSYLENEIIAQALRELTLVAERFNQERAAQEPAGEDVLPPVKINEEAPPPEEVVPQAPDPYVSIIPACSVCKQLPEAYPVYTCESCIGKTIVCQNCLWIFSDPRNPHKTHHIRILVRDLWFGMKHHLYVPTGIESICTDAAISSLTLGYNIFKDQEVLEFFPVISGHLPASLLNVPAGQWEVRLQISTWPSPSFGEAQVKSLNFMKRMSVKAGTTAIGFIKCSAGAVDDGVSFLHTEDHPIRTSQNTVSHVVGYGTLTSLKVTLPQPIVVAEGQHVAFFFNWMRNSDAFVKEKIELQNGLSFCWRLEGIRFVQRAEIG